MARPIDHERRAQLLDDAVDHIAEHRVTDLSFRPLARALGVSTTTLVHHFGTKDELLVALMTRVRTRLMAIALAPAADARGHDVTVRAWNWSASREHEHLFRLFFALYGLALQSPERFESFLDRVVDDWLDAMADRARGTEVPAHEVRARATLGLAVVRGLLLDLLTTGDRARVDAALRHFVELRIDPKRPSV
jgi:AcrR family transcriptional regulator